MKTIIIKLIAAILLITFSVGCKKEKVAPAVSTQKSQTTSSENSLLWEISGNGLSRPSYLFGTLHSIPVSEMQFTSVLDSLIAAGNQVVLEADITNQNIASTMSHKSYVPSGVNVQQLYSKDEWALITKVCTTKGINLNLVRKLKPIIAGSIVHSSLAFGPNAAHTSYEQTLIQLSEAHRQPIAGLESKDYVNSYLDSIPLAIQARDFLDMIRQYNKDPLQLKTEYDKLKNTYLEQDMKRLSELMNAEGDEIYYEHLIRNRNHKWIAKIDHRFSSKLIAVGAGHLSGSDGLIALLRQKGFTLKALEL